MTQLAPYALEEATSVDGLTVPLQVFHARWSGNPETVDLQEGVLLRWFTPDMLERLNLSPGLGDLIRRHAAEHPPAGSPPPPTRLLCNDAPQATELHIVGVHLYLEDTHGRILLGLRHPDSAYAGNTARSPVPCGHRLVRLGGGRSCSILIRLRCPSTTPGVPGQGQSGDHGVEVAGDASGEGVEAGQDAAKEVLFRQRLMHPEITTVRADSGYAG